MSDILLVIFGVIPLFIHLLLCISIYICYFAGNKKHIKALRNLITGNISVLSYLTFIAIIINYIVIVNINHTKERVINVIFAIIYTVLIVSQFYLHISSSAFQNSKYSKKDNKKITYILLLFIVGLLLAGLHTAKFINTDNPKLKKISRTSKNYFLF